MSIRSTSWALLLILYFVKLSDGFCPIACECNEVALSVSCAKSQLEVLPITLNPGIQRLQLQNNNIRAVDAALGFYAQLRYVDLSHNQLISLPDRGFIQQKKLIELRLSNNKIFKVTNSTFDGLKTVTILSLRKNFLEELSGSAFSGLTSVEELDLGQNRIQTIAEDTFLDLDHLRVLYLDDNDLQEVPSPALRPLPHLAELNLGLNNIKNLADNSFSSIVNLYSLDLHGCAILNISTKAFESLETLRVLKLSANSLDKVPTSQLQHLERLEELTLGKNFFTRLPDHALRGLRKLRVLDLSECPELSEVTSLALASNPDLGSLSLTGSRQVRLAPGALASLSQLTSLHLADLDWRTVDRDLVQWAGLQTLDLAYNPLECDCHLAWLRDVIRATGNQSRATCHGPAGVSGEDLRDLEAGAMRCGGLGLMASAPHSLLAAACVLAGLLTAGLIVTAVHCQRKLFRGWLWPKSGSCSSLQCCRLGGGGHRGFSCDKYRHGGQTSPGTSGGGDSELSVTMEASLYYSDRTMGPYSLQPRPVSQAGTLDWSQGPGHPLPSLPSLPTLPDKLGSGLYYPSSTKSSYCEDDYFLSLSKDRKTFKPIRVCEL